MSVVAAVEVLYAEDDADDRLLAEMAHRQSGALNPLVMVEDGQQALDYLRRAGRYADRPGTAHPGVVLLDLNMPGIDGHETLRIIRADPLLRHIPVVMLTTSDADKDVVTSYDAGANSYIVKPSNFASLVQVFERVRDYLG